MLKGSSSPNSTHKYWKELCRDEEGAKKHLQSSKERPQV